MEQLINFVSENKIQFGHFGCPESTHNFIEFYLPSKNNLFNDLWRLIESADFNIIDVDNKEDNLTIKTDMASFRLRNLNSSW